MQLLPNYVRFQGKSGHRGVRVSRLLLTRSGHQAAHAGRYKDEFIFILNVSCSGFDFRQAPAIFQMQTVVHEPVSLRFFRP
jgi:hypothetical protein